MARSILGDVKLRVPVGGRIRAGMKVLKRSAAKNELAQKIYDEGLADGLDFDEIGERLEKEAKVEKALIPFNAPWFTVRKADFRVPSVVDDLMSKYGEVRTVHPGVKHLYAMPIVLATDDWLDVIPHTFRCYQGGTLRYWADYDETGERMCYTHAPVQAEDLAQRKQFPKRVIMMRKENKGRCDPDRCEEHASGQCKLRGFVRFYVYGMKGMSLFEVPTSSFYSLTGIRAELDQLVQVRGRMSGLHNGKPLLWITKERKEISRYSLEHKRYVKEKQWLIVFHVLEQNVETLLQGPSSVASVPLLAQAQQQSTGSTDVASDAEPTPETAKEGPQPAQQPGANVQPQAAAGANAKGGGDPYAEIKRMRAELYAILQERDVPNEVFGVRAEELYGLSWGRDSNALRSLLDEARKCPDKEAYQDLIVEGESAPQH